MTPYARIVGGMTQTMKHRMAAWRRRTGFAALGAVVAVAAVLGPPTPVTARAGAAGEVVGYASVLVPGVSKTLESV